jgi:hypothetical protein
LGDKSLQSTQILDNKSLHALLVLTGLSFIEEVQVSPFVRLCKQLIKFPSTFEYEELLMIEGTHITLAPSIEATAASQIS